MRLARFFSAKILISLEICDIIVKIVFKLHKTRYKKDKAYNKSR